MTDLACLAYPHLDVAELCLSMLYDQYEGCNESRAGCIGQPHSMSEKQPLLDGMQVPQRRIATHTCAYRSPDMLVDSAPEATIAIESPSISEAQRGDMNSSHAAAGAAGGISFPRARSEHGVKQPYIKRLIIR